MCFGGIRGTSYPRADAGHEEEEIVGQHFSAVFAPEDIRRGVPEEELAHAEVEKWGKDERRHGRKDGTRFYASGSVRPVCDEEGF